MSECKVMKVAFILGLVTLINRWDHTCTPEKPFDVYNVKKGLVSIVNLTVT